MRTVYISGVPFFFSRVLYTARLCVRITQNWIRRNCFYEIPCVCILFFVSTQLNIDNHAASVFYHGFTSIISNDLSYLLVDLKTGNGMQC